MTQRHSGSTKVDFPYSDQIIPFACPKPSALSTLHFIWHPKTPLEAKAALALHISRPSN